MCVIIRSVAEKFRLRPWTGTAGACAQTGHDKGKETILRKSKVLILFVALFTLLTSAAFAAKPKDRPRDPKTVWIYHTYLDVKEVTERGTQVSAYTKVMGGDGPIKIKADLLCYGKVVDSFDWQEDPTIVFTPELPTHPNGIYVFRVTATDGKTEWTEDSLRLYVNRRDVSVVTQQQLAKVGQPLNFTVYTTNLPKRSELIYRVIDVDTGDVVHEVGPLEEPQKEQTFAYTPEKSGMYALLLDVSPNAKTTYSVASNFIKVIPVPKLSAGLN